jgi:SAM-dependent methyltransferase
LEARQAVRQNCITRRAWLAHALAALPVLSATGEENPNPRPPRKPAPVMSYHGAGWLERPERLQEERPYEVLDVMQLKDGDVVADIGCGSGYFARKMARRVAPSGKVYGVEIQPEMLELLRKFAAFEGVHRIIVPVLGTETDPLLPAASCDWLFLADVYHEFQQPAPMLEKMRQALKPDGRVLLLEYRLLGDTAKHIRAEHRMSVEQVLGEWEPAGFSLDRLLEFLPSQHLFVFRKSAAR